MLRVHSVDAARKKWLLRSHAAIMTDANPSQCARHLDYKVGQLRYSIFVKATYVRSLKIKRSWVIKDTNELPFCRVVTLKHAMYIAVAWIKMVWRQQHELSANQSHDGVRCDVWNRQRNAAVWCHLCETVVSPGVCFRGSPPSHTQ